jgi:hypothetical protein
MKQVAMWQCGKATEKCLPNPNQLRRTSIVSVRLEDVPRSERDPERERVSIFTCTVHWHSLEEGFATRSEAFFRDHQDPVPSCLHETIRRGFSCRLMVEPKQ